MPSTVDPAPCWANVMSTPQTEGTFVSRGGVKLTAALEQFRLDVSGAICADLGSHVGGFVDCLLRRGAAKVYSIDTSYGVLAWKLRKDPRVVVMERTNAMHAALPEQAAIVTIDVGWTRQDKILPAVSAMLAPRGRVVTLIKPQYEADPALLQDGVVGDEDVDAVLASVTGACTSLGWDVLATAPSPIRGHGGNREYFALLRR